MEYQIFLTIHIVSVVMLLGIGGGSAFYKLMADLSKDTPFINHINKLVVKADWFFTTPAVILQPLSGYMLVKELNIPLDTPWLLYSIWLYIFSILSWIVAVYLQIKMHKISMKASQEDMVLDGSYYRLFRYWIGLGVVSFVSMVYIFYLMIFKP